MIKREKPLMFSLLPILVMIFGFVAFLFSGFSGFRYPLGAIFDQGKTSYRTVGRIDAIYPGPSLPVYLHADGTWSTGRLVEVKGERYYLPDPNVEPGQWVELHFKMQERPVFQCTVLSEEEGRIKEVTDSAIPTQPTSAETAQQEQYRRIGSWLAMLGFGAIFAIAMTEALFGNKLEQYFFQRDLQFHKGIQPNLIGFALDGAIACCIAVALTGQWLLGSNGIVIIGIMFFLVWGSILLSKLTSSMEIDGEQLIYRKLWSRRIISVHSLSSINWERVGRAGSYCLVIRLDTGEKLVWEQQNYCGLHDFANHIKAFADKQ